MDNPESTVDIGHKTKRRRRITNGFEGHLNTFNTTLEKTERLSRMCNREI